MKKSLLLIFLSLVLFNSCGNPYHLAKSNVLNNADLTKYKTFMIQAAEQSCLPEGWLVSDAQNVAKAIVAQLESRGYKRVSTNPEMIVYLAASEKQVIETKDAIPPTATYGYRYFGPRAAYAHSYYDNTQIISDIRVEGQLMMDIVDSQDNIHIFCAELTAEKGSMDIKDLTQINEAIATLFSKFPSKQ